MNKKLIALAVAGACAAPVAMAQTANPVTLYGVVRANFESVEAKGGTTSLPRRNRVQDRVSLFGIRGTEDLGGGLKAFFQLETPFFPDQNDTTFASRNSAVGLQGGFGSILLGRWDTPMKVAAASAVDPWGDIGLPDVTSASLRSGGFSQRAINTVQWWSPSWGGVSMRAMYSANEGKTATVNPHNFGASVSYTKGSLYLAYAYEEHKDSVGLTATAGVNEKGNVVAARFGMGPFRIMGNYGEYKRTNTRSNKGYYLGADYTAGKSVFMVSFANSKDGGSTTAASQPECDVLGVGYKYNFSRRTMFIIEYADIKNNAAATCTFGHGGLTVSAGQDPKGFGAGLSVSF